MKTPITLIFLILITLLTFSSAQNVPFATFSASFYPIYYTVPLAVGDVPKVVITWDNPATIKLAGMFVTPAL